MGRRSSPGNPDLGLSPDPDIHLPEVLFEFRQIGRMVRVSAIDPLSGTEVHMAGDARRGETALKRVAARKLLYVLRKQRDRAGR